MLQPIMEKLSTKRIVLASSSPRRKQILSNIGLTFEVIPSTFEETLDKSKFKYPYDYVKETAKEKTLQVATLLQKDQVKPDLIIGADTIVTMDDRIYEKPRSREEAFQMLSGFSGRSHTVYTGVVLAVLKTDDLKKEIGKEYEVHSFHESTDVLFAEIDSEIIRGYIDTKEPMDKAGGYGIQEKGGTLVQSINGDYFNVMGFPLHQFAKKLLQIFQSS